MTGTSHNAEIKPGMVVVGTTGSLEIGYNKQPLTWSKHSRVYTGKRT